MKPVAVVALPTELAVAMVLLDSVSAIDALALVMLKLTVLDEVLLPAASRPWA